MRFVIGLLISAFIIFFLVTAVVGLVLSLLPYLIIGATIAAVLFVAYKLARHWLITRAN